MPPKAKGKGKGKKTPVEPPKPVPDLEWEEVPYVCPSYNQLFNQKIRIRIRSLFAIMDTQKQKRLDTYRAGQMVRVAGMFPSDKEMDDWFLEIGAKRDDEPKAGEEDFLFVEKNALCDGIYELLRQGRWKPPSPTKAIAAWRRLDMAQKGKFNVENIGDMFAQEEKDNGMSPTELKRMMQWVSEMPSGEMDYVNYVDYWYKALLQNRISRPRDRQPRRHFDDTI